MYQPTASRNPSPNVFVGAKPKKRQAVRWCRFSRQVANLIPTLGRDGNEDDEEALRREFQGECSAGGDPWGFDAGGTGSEA